MQAAAAEERFEDAARYRNRLFAVQHLAERQAAERRSVGTVDVDRARGRRRRAAVQMFPLRDGKLVDRYSFHLENVGGQDMATLVEAFCLEYYGSRAERAAADRRPGVAGDTSALAAFLSERRGSRVEVRTPERGEKRRLQELADAERAARARVGCGRVGAEASAARRGARGAARGAEPREPAGPDRVLRHLDDPGVGDRRRRWSCSRTRRRRRRTTASSRCAARTGRTTSRRWRRWSRGASRAPGAHRPARTTTRASPPAPNLVVVDGGKGQLSAALEAMHAFDLPRVAVIALAKRTRRCSSPAAATPILLDRSSAGLQLLQRLRDEAHRFALGFHRAAPRAPRRASRSSTSSRGSARRGGGRCSRTSARPSGSWPHHRRSSRACRASRRRPRVPIYAQLHKAGRA